VASRKKKPGVPEAVRRAVERTFQTTLGSAALTRERAQELADDVLGLAEQRAARAGRGVREAGHRQREVAAGVGDRVRDAIAELRALGADDVGKLRAELDALRRRVEQLERRGEGGRARSAATARRASAKPSKRATGKTTERTTAARRKTAAPSGSNRRKRTTRS
jgi:polyhydroxyalkanoate synthesis regulator phasin